MQAARVGTCGHVRPLESGPRQPPPDGPPPATTWLRSSSGWGPASVTRTCSCRAAASPARPAPTMTTERLLRAGHCLGGWASRPKLMKPCLRGNTHSVRLCRPGTLVLPRGTPAEKAERKACEPAIPVLNLRAGPVFGQRPRDVQAPLGEDLYTGRSKPRYQCSIVSAVLGDARGCVSSSRRPRPCPPEQRSPPAHCVHYRCRGWSVTERGPSASGLGTHLNANASRPRRSAIAASSWSVTRRILGGARAGTACQRGTQRFPHQVLCNHQQQQP
jgi:hypothetical protein